MMSPMTLPCRFPSARSLWRALLGLAAATLPACSDGQQSDEVEPADAAHSPDVPSDTSQDVSADSDASEGKESAVEAAVDVNAYEGNVIDAPQDAADSGGDAPLDVGPKGCQAGALVATADGIDQATSCSGSYLHLLPRVQIGDAWQGGGKDGVCTVTPKSVQCPAGPAGQVEATVDGSKLVISFTAAQDVVVQALSVEGDAEVPFAKAWLSNGYQSWSQSGVITIVDAPAESAVQTALHA